MSGNPEESDVHQPAPLPGVSVIIPTRNRKDFLRRAIDSILEQDYPTVEIIVIDDASTDGTDQAVEEYGDRVRYFYREPNMGPSAARNFAFQHATHPYIAFLDSDDYWAPNRLSSAMQVWQTLPDSVAILANDITLFDDQNRHFLPKRLTLLRAGKISTKDLLLRNRFAPSAAMIKRSAYEEFQGFDEHLLASEDRDLWIRVSGRHEIYFHTERLTFMRKHPANISKEADRMRASIRGMLTKSFRNRVLPRWHIITWLRARSFGYFVVACLNNYERRRWLAWAYLVASCCTWPFHIRTQADLNEPALFRLRMAVHFIRLSWASNPKTAPVKATHTA